MSLPIQSTPNSQSVTFGGLPARARPAAVPDEGPDPALPADGVTLSKTKAAPAPAVVSSSAPVENSSPVNPTPIPTVITTIGADGKTAVVHFIYDNDKRDSLKNLTLMGSWDNTGKYSQNWDQSTAPMQPIGDGKFEATVKLDASGGQNYQWGVKADAPYGKQQWAMFTENPPSFEAKPGEQTQTYAPRTYAQKGVTKQGDDARMKFWAEAADNVNLVVYDKMDQKPTVVPLTKDDQGYWSGVAKDQWKNFEGKSYGFAVTADGETNVRPDPYARQVQGQLRGVGDLYLNPTDGSEVNKYWKTQAAAPPTPPAPMTGLVADGTLPAYPAPTSIDGPATSLTLTPTHFLRFEVQRHAEADQVKLRLFGADGQALSKSDLEARVGQSGAGLVHHFEGAPGSYWHDQISDDGAINLKREGSDAWSTVVDKPDALKGLKYQFEVWDKDAKGNPVLVGDLNHDGKLSAVEAAQTAFNDPYDNTIKDVGSQRLSVVRSDDFDWKNPSPQLDKNKAIIYQVHVGSFMGEANNARRSTFKDLTDNLDFIKDMGVTTIETLPTNPFEGSDDWGYLGTSSTAVAEQYGFEDKDGKWVCGPEAMKRFVDAAHGKGLTVMDDQVFNHWGGDFNPMWNVDGKSNSAMTWAPGQLKNTDWGPMPAMNKEFVNQFFQDASASRLDDFHLDGIRDDFTAPTHTDGWGGGKAGWDMWRQDNRQSHFNHPNTIRAAEEFPPQPIISSPAGPNGSGGMGFDGQWDTERQHLITHANGGEGSILQQAVNNQRTDMDKVMTHLIEHPGYAEPQNQINIISNHDEVGNADRTINVARNYQDDRPPTSFERGSVRTTFALGMLSPGIPLFFTGEESLASNTFKWGIPSTWDSGWEWRDKKFDTAAAAEAVSQGKEASFAAAAPGAPTVEDIYRRLHFDFCKDAIATKKSSPAFDANIPAERVYTHNDNSVAAFSRQSGDDKFIVVSSLNHNNQPNYNIPLEDGKWQLVLDSDDKKYGGTGMGKPTIEGGQQAHFDLPAGGTLVYKKVG